jgi:hypothetical protein
MRARIEQRSAVTLIFLRKLPRATVPLATVVLLVAGLALRGFAGGAFLLMLAVFLGWTGYLSWPAIDARGRLLRVAALVMLCVIALLQFTR